MASIDIYSLNDLENQNVIATLPKGTHVIGRGDLLNVTDKRVSRKHAIIDVTDDKITLTAVHQNPCFYKASQGRTLTVIKQNQQNELGDGDQFSLLPESYWFKVKIIRNDDLGDNNTVSPVSFNKRPYEDGLDITDENINCKKGKLQPEILVTNFDPSLNTSCDLNNSAVKIEEIDPSDNLEGSNKREQMSTSHMSEISENLHENKHEVKDDDASSLNNTSHQSDKDPKIEQVDEAEKKDEENKELKPEIKQEIDKNEPDNASQNEANCSSSTENNTDKVQTKQNEQKNNGDAANTKQKRESCWYGEKCFRKNPAHKSTFSHPGDDDYQIDPKDALEDCPYGTACYQTNIEHRRKYRHTAKPAPKPPQTNTRPVNGTKQRRTKKKPKATYANDSSEDDYDFDDPFLNDESSDDFRPTDEEDSDTDWEDSQEIDDSSEAKRMVKEARKFTKKK